MAIKWDNKVKTKGIKWDSEPKEKKRESISSEGLSYLTKHPYKSFFNDPTETITGKSLLERSQEIPIERGRIGIFEEPDISYIPRATIQGTIRDMSSLVAGSLASPVSLATMGIGAIPAAGKTVAQVAGRSIAGTRAGQVIGKILKTDI